MVGTELEQRLVTICRTHCLSVIPRTFADSCPLTDEPTLPKIGQFPECGQYFLLFRAFLSTSYKWSANCHCWGEEAKVMRHIVQEDFAERVPQTSRSSIQIESFEE